MEASNMKTMREILLDIKSEAETTSEYRDYPIAGAPDERGYCKVVDADYLIDKCNEALSAPPRNCDVGTAEEQAERFGAMCNKYYNDEYECDKRCPLSAAAIIHGFPRCQAYWAQMPYEEGGAK